MKKIFKYKMPFTDLPEVELPAGAEILTVDKQGDSMENFYSEDHHLFAWAIVDEDETNMEIRKFRIAGTGHPLGFDEEINEKYKRLKYLNTVQIFEGKQIYHVFEILQK